MFPLLLVCGPTTPAGSKKSNDLATFVEARLGKPSHLLEGDKLKQFLANNGKVLRFWAVWDDRTDMYGDRRPYVVHIYLEDDTIEINEVCVWESVCGCVESVWVWLWVWVWV